MTTPTIQDATLDLLLQVNRMLDEADAVRALRDRLIETAQASMLPPPTASPDRREVVSDAR